MGQRTEQGSTAEPEPDAVPIQVRAAVWVVWLEVLALVAACVALIVETAIGHANSVGAALSVVGLAAVAAIMLALGARGLLRLSPAARTPVAILELLALLTSFSPGFQAGRIWYRVPIMIAAAAVLYLLFTPPARTALDREV